MRPRWWTVCRYYFTPKSYNQYKYVPIEAMKASIISSHPPLHKSRALQISWKNGQMKLPLKGEKIK